MSVTGKASGWCRITWNRRSCITRRRPLYAWHLSYPPQEQFAFLPPIHFFRQGLPDYFVIFGPAKLEVEKLIKTLAGEGVEYRLEQVLTCTGTIRRAPEYFGVPSAPPINFAASARPFTFTGTLGSFTGSTGRSCHNVLGVIHHKHPKIWYPNDQADTVKAACSPTPSVIFSGFSPVAARFRDEGQ